MGAWNGSAPMLCRLPLPRPSPTHPGPRGPRASLLKRLCDRPPTFSGVSAAPGSSLHPVLRPCVVWPWLPPAYSLCSSRVSPLSSGPWHILFPHTWDTLSLSCSWAASTQISRLSWGVHLSGGFSPPDFLTPLKLWASLCPLVVLGCLGLTCCQCGQEHGRALSLEGRGGGAALSGRLSHLAMHTLDFLALRTKTDT